MLVCGVLILTGLATPTSGGEVLLVVSQEAPPYQQAERRLVEVLRRHGHQTRSVMLSEAVAGGVGLDQGGRADTLEVAIGTQAAVWLHERLPNSEVFGYCMVSDPESFAFTQERPTFGVSTDVPVARQFELIREALPEVRSVGMLYRSDVPKSMRNLSKARAALPAQWRLHAVAVDHHGSVAGAIDALFKEDLDVVWTALDPEVYNLATIRSVLLGGLRRKVPVFGFSPAFVRAGALVGVGIDPGTQGEQLAELLLRRLEDAGGGAASVSPAASVVVPRYEVAVNLIVAEQLRIRISRPLIERTEHVYKGE